MADMIVHQTAEIAPAGLTFGEEQLRLLRDMAGAQDAPPAEFGAFVELARARQLNPFTRQIWLIGRHDARQGRKVWSSQVSIDGLRALAERTGRYAGQDEPEYELDAAGRPVLARVRVYRHDWPRPSVGVARMAEYAAPGPMWQRMPFLMLAKCFDPLTEVLTTAGFERFDSVTGRVLQLTDGGLEATDAAPFSQPWSGDMITLDSDDLNFSVTPNHDMITSLGKIEAWELYDVARARPSVYVPRCVDHRADGLGMSRPQLVAAAAYIADGQDVSARSFTVVVSRTKKVEALRAIAPHLGATERAVRCAGSVAHTDKRDITTKSDKVAFLFRFEQIAAVCGPNRAIDANAILRMSRDEARIFVDALVFFDGARQAKSGVRRFYSSRPGVMSAFELAAVVAGYSVSNRKARTSDISDRVNQVVTISDRSLIPVIRWGREYKGKGGNDRQRTGIETTKNDAGIVWCVTVPSGRIVVRRNGFSMICGNCAEALALRKAFPESTSGLYTAEEMDQATGELRPVVVPATPVAPAPAPAPAPREPAPAAPPQDPEAGCASALVAEPLRLAILAAGSLDELRAASGRVAAAVRAGTITDEHRAALLETYGARKAALAAPVVEAEEVAS